MEKKEKGFNFAFGKLMRDSPVKRGYKNSDSFLEIPTHFLVLEKSVRVKENHVWDVKNLGGTVSNRSAQHDPRDSGPVMFKLLIPQDLILFHQFDIGKDDRVLIVMISSETSYKAL